MFSEKSIKKEKKKENTEGKIYSPVGNLAERAKQVVSEMVATLALPSFFISFNPADARI